MINLSMADPEHNLRPRLTVMGIGGAGGNAINNMIRCNLEGCDFIGANTDSQALATSLAPRKIQLGINMSRGLGAGSKPDMGRAAAEEQLADIIACLEGSDMLFVTAGMGGGTGTGAAPVIARAARESGILTVGVVTKPFHFEGGNRMRAAEMGIAELQQYVDTLIVIPNQNLFRIANERTTFAEAFRLADEVLHAGVRGITDLMVMPGFMNLDFADVRTVMGEMGKAMMGTGEADGDHRAIRAAEAAISNPLLDDVSMKGARGVLINITGGLDMTLFEVDQAANRIREEVDPEAQIKVGSTLGENMDGRLRVSVIATGIDAGVLPASQRSSAANAGTGRATPPPPSFTQGLRSAQQQGSSSGASVPGVRNLATSGTQIHSDAAQNGSAVAATAATVTPSVNANASYFTMPHAVTPQALAREEAQGNHAPVAQTGSGESVEEEDRGTADVSPETSQSSLGQHPAPVLQTARAAESPQRYQPQGYAPRALAPTSAPHSVQKPAPFQNSSETNHVPYEMRVTQLTPPASQGASAADQRRMRRSESLFTRITGFGLVRPSAQQEEVEEAHLPDEAISSAQALGIDPADRPALSTENTTDRLEIPAFLRRQTNH